MDVQMIYMVGGASLMVKGESVDHVMDQVAINRNDPSHDAESWVRFEGADGTEAWVRVGQVTHVVAAKEYGGSASF